jgi:hypothetical protein
MTPLLSDARQDVPWEAIAILSVYFTYRNLPRVYVETIEAAHPEMSRTDLAKFGMLLEKKGWIEMAPVHGHCVTKEGEEIFLGTLRSLQGLPGTGGP